MPVSGTSRAGFGMGDGAPCGRARVAGWATARVAPTRALFGSDGTGRHLVRRKRSRAGFGMGGGAPCGRDRVAGWATARVAPTRALSSPMPVSRGLVWVGRDATSCEGNEAVLDSGWAAARPAGAIGSRDGRPRGSPLRGLVVARCRFPEASFGSDGTPPRAKETKPCWIRDGRPRGSPLRGPCPTLVVAHAGFPRPRLGRYGTPQGRIRRRWTGSRTPDPRRG